MTGKPKIEDLSSKNLFIGKDLQELTTDDR